MDIDVSLSEHSDISMEAFMDIDVSLSEHSDISMEAVMDIDVSLSEHSDISMEAVMDPLLLDLPDGLSELEQYWEGFQYNLSLIIFY